ncbi:MAG: signal peptide peptidase SppA [Myxococcota bacterium]|nr:signal peptide peptidase SppA [Myxococcota bacterium]
MIRIPILAVLTLLALPVRILVTLMLRLKRRSRSVLVLSLSAGRKGLEPVVYERMLVGLRDAAADQNIAGLRVQIQGLPFGWSQLYEMHEAIAAVRDSGTFVECHLDSVTDRELLLAGACNRVSVSPAGEVYLQGVASAARFFGSALARHDVVVDFESAGAYKSFGEAYTRSAPTPQNREAMDYLLSDLHDRFCGTIARDRGQSEKAVHEAMAASPLSAAQAAERGLIDAVAYPDEDRKLWEERLGGEPREADLMAYARLRRILRRLPALRSKPAVIAVVHLDGPVVERRAQMPRKRRVIASDEVVDTIDRLAEQDSVKAVVLAVNSPGGSALASDLIARSVQALDDRKPVVAVMGNVAASGGYYISAVAREIVAHPATITGSIGVVGGKVVLGKALARLGIHTTWMGPAPDPGLLSPEAPFSPDQRIRFRASLKRVYRRFIDVVAKGRGLDIDAVESVAQGRVWTGTQALDRGLVDRLGSLSLGIERAAALAELGDGRIKTVPVRFNPPAFAVVNQLMGAQAASIDARVASMAGADGLLVHALAIDAGKPLMMLPTVLDQGAWRTWTGSP